MNGILQTHSGSGSPESRICPEKGMKGFNFLRGREDYKYHLGGREEVNYRLRAEKI